MKRRTLLAGALGGLAGCATLPTKGDIRTEPRRTQAGGSGEAAIDPNPPAAGASPELIVQGFMLAMATYQPGYPAARLYLTESARRDWHPESGLAVYADGNAPRAYGDQVVLDAPVVAALDRRGAYTAVVGSAPMHHDFMLVREHGEWRISHPPPGLLMSRYLFVTSHVQADVYFFDGTLNTLVPDSRYFPRGNRIADAAVRALLAGPSDWLRPAVVSAIPDNLALTDDVVGQGTYTITLKGDGSGLADPVRPLVAAQLAATLRLVPDVTGFRASVDGQALTTPEGGADGTIPVAVASRYDPVARLTTQLFGVSGGHLVRIGDGPGGAPRPVSGDFGTKAREISSFAISPDGTEAVVVAGDTLLRGGVEGPSRTVLTAAGLRRPQLSVTGAAWAVSEGGVFHRIVNDVASAVPAPALSGLSVIAFRVAPDGQRMAVVAESQGRRVLGLVRIDKEPTVMLSGWRPVPLVREGSPAGGILDVGWTSPSTLVVLVATGASEQGVVELDIDGVQVRETGRVERWGATTVASSARSGPAARTVVLAQDGVAWQYLDAFRWAKLAEGITAAAYPG